MTGTAIPELVARLRELHEKATPGPWSTNLRGGGISARIRGHEVQVALACGQGAMWDERDDAAAIMRANAELIAELRSSLPAILDALERGTDALARAWEEGAEAAFDAEDPGPDSDGRPMTEPLTQAQVDTLADGTRILVTWSGGNGPHEYVVRVIDGRRYAALPEGHPWRRDDEDTRPQWDAALEWVGEHPRTQVWLLNPKETPTP